MKRLFFFFIFSLISLDVFAACRNAFTDSYRTDSWVKTYVISRNAAAGYGNFELGKYIYYVGGPNRLVRSCDTLEEVPTEYCTGAANNCSGTTAGSPNPFYDQEGACHSANKPFNPSTGQCADSCSVGTTVSPLTNECEFTGCPSGYVQFGEMCKTLPEPQGEGQYFCDNDGCSWVAFDDLPFVDISCTVKSRNYLGHFNGVAKCAYIDGEAYDQQDINDSSAAGAGSCGAGYSEQYINDVLYCLEGNESISPDLPVCTPPKIGVNGGCEYPPYYNSQQTQQGIIIGEDGTEKEYIVNQSVSTDRYGNSVTTSERLEAFCDYVDNVRICSDFELVESSVIDDSEAEKSSVSGGESCSSGYSCTGDAIQCAALTELHAIRCASEVDGDLPDQQPNTDFIDDYDFSGLNSDLSTGVDNSLTSLSSKYDTLANKYGGESDLVSNVDLSEFVFDDVQLVTGTCPASFDFELGFFGVVAFDMTPFCTFLGYISYLVRLSASLFALRLTFATVSKL